MTCYRRMLSISWKDHRTNESVMNEIGENRELVATVRKQTTVLRVHDHSTEPLHIHFSRSSGWQMQRKTTEKMDKWYKRLDWQGSGGVRVNRNSWREPVHCSTVSDLQHWKLKTTTTTKSWLNIKIAQMRLEPANYHLSQIVTASDEEQLHRSRPTVTHYHYAKLPPPSYFPWTNLHCLKFTNYEPARPALQTQWQRWFHQHQMTAHQHHQPRNDVLLSPETEHTTTLCFCAVTFFAHMYSPLACPRGKVG